MADKKIDDASDAPPTFSDADKQKARRWFQQGKTVVETRNYEYGIECYITGLGFWPEAVEEGHMLLRAISVARLNAGGKKPGMLVPMGAGAAAGNVARSVAISGASNILQEGVSESLEGAAKRTAKEIAKVIVKAYKERGWL